MTLSRVFMLRLTEQQLIDLAQILVTVYENPEDKKLLAKECAISEEQIGELAIMFKRRLNERF